MISPVTPPESDLKRPWERAEAIRELIRGRMEAAGPITVRALAEFVQLPQAEIEAALLALEAEGFLLRGRFHPDAAGLDCPLAFVPFGCTAEALGACTPPVWLLGT